MKRPPSSAGASSHNHGHRERLRERFLDAPEKLADYEILELLLGHVLLRRDTKPLAKELLVRFGSLTRMLNARPEELRAVPGVGNGVAGFFLLLREFMARYGEAPLQLREQLSSPQAVAQAARMRIGSLPHEEVWVAYVDNRNRLISWEKAMKGTVDASAVYPRDIMERALALKATGFIMVHNHPGGEPSPSGADMRITEQLQRAAQTLSIRFLDHIVVTETTCYSLMSEGFL